MALMSDAVMLIFCDVSSDPEDHDDWHSTEHMHERLSIRGFLRGSRWTRTAGSPRYMIAYEVSGVHMADAPDYLQRLNDPTPWTSSTMKRLRAMSRGFCKVTASAGYGLGRVACVLRLAECADEGRRWLSDGVARIGSSRGIASVHLLEADAPAPMTKEQSIRGADAPMTTVMIAMAYDAAALQRACAPWFDREALARNALEPLDIATYELGFTATAAEVSRTPAIRPGRPRSAP